MGWNDFRPLFLLFIFTDCGFSSLDITELSSFQYNIDISNQPVLFDETGEKEGVLLSSKHGQKYQCQFESLSKFSQKVRDEEENASKMSVPELLKIMETKPCLTLTTGWWTFEFCYKGQIKQYHMTEQKIVGDILHLGSYSEEFDWDKTDNKKVPEIRNRFHSQQYVNGSLCDLTGTTRSAEVRFKCKEDSADTIDGVEEPSTCKYLVHISTSHLCRHPSLRSLPDKKLLPITCNPVLDVSDYNDYMEVQARLKEEGEKRGLLGEEKGDSSGVESDLEKVTSDLDSEFGYIEIGNTKVKFYVLNIDPTTSEDEKKDETSEETSESDKISNGKLTASSTTTSTSLISTSSSSESSSSSTSSSSTTASPLDILEMDGSKEIDSNDDDDGIPDDLFGDDTKEFLEIYKRLLSNKKLKSFVNKNNRDSVKVNNQERSITGEEKSTQGKDSTQTTQGKDSIQTSQDKDSTQTTQGKDSTQAIQGKDSTQDTQNRELEMEEEKVIKKEGSDVVKNVEEDDRLVVEGEVKESDEVLRGIQDDKDKLTEKGGDDDDDDELKVDKSRIKIETKVVGDLFKKDNQFPEEHKNIQQMIMAIIRQSDKNTKEVSRHEEMLKNYDFNWEKQKRQKSKTIKSDGLKEEL